MRLPISAIIAPEKIREYLLSPKKRNDKSKWLSKAGYTRRNWQELEANLRTQILTMDAELIEESVYGQIYEIRGSLTGPNGKSLSVRTIWMTEYETKITKFITMFPDKKQDNDEI